MLTLSKEKYREVLQVAENLYRQSPDWITFFREVLGIDGTVRKAFPSFEELTEFEKSEEFDRIQQFLLKLRETRTVADPDTEPTRVITVRLPKSMHEYLRTEAHDLRTSMNKLCISKLLQVIGEDKIPVERTATTKKVPASSPPSNNSTLAGNSTLVGNSTLAVNHQPAPAPAPVMAQGPQSLQQQYRPTQPRF